MTSNQCPVCRYEQLDDDVQENYLTKVTYYSCSNCGEYRLSSTVKGDLRDERKTNPLAGPLLSRAIRKMQGRSESPLIIPELFKQIIADTRVPSPAEQADDFVLWFGDNTTPGQRHELKPETHSAVMGATDGDNFMFVAEHLIKGELLISGSPDARHRAGISNATLTFAGWKRHKELKRGTTYTRRAFMAMPYKDKRLDKVFLSFREAIDKTGFQLYRLDDEPKAGLIDNRLRVALRRCRFVVAELTNGNEGVYWESGFAEGLGKPVIYTCEESYFEQKRTHFDTSHLHTVKWRKDDLDDACEELKETIRATLPAEAQLSDDSEH